MKQVVQQQRNGRTEVMAVPALALRPNGVLVQTAYSLISAGTERAKVALAKKNLLGKALARPEPVRQAIQLMRQVGVAAAYQKITSRLEALGPLGYSASGVVIAVGAQAPGLTAGERVACAGGGYANHAEVNFVPHTLCARVPDSVTLEEAAFGTLGAIALQGVRQAGPTIGESVGVIGLGLLGLLTVQLLRAAGCRVVGVEINPQRAELGRRLGANAVAAPNDAEIEAVARRWSPAGLDTVIITAATDSSEPVRLAGRLCRDRGRVIVVGAVGMEVPRSPFYEKELDLRLSRSYGPGRYDAEYEEKGRDYPIGYVRWTEGRNLGAFLDLVAQRKVDVGALISHRFALEAAEAAYTLIEGKTKEPFLGVLLDYGLAQAPVAQPLATARVPVRPAPVPERVVRLALLGAGSFAQPMLLPHLKRMPDVQLQVVVTPSGLTARSVAERAGFAQCASEAEAALGDPSVNLVLIASRHDSHAGLATRALAAGKAVFVEKPLALNAAELQQVAEAYGKSPTPFLMVGFNRRFAPLTIALRDFMADTKEPLLAHYRINAGYLPRDDWTQDPQVGGGRLLGEICHFIDLLLHLVGQAPVEVWAQALPDAGRYSRDNLSIGIRYADGTASSILYAANGDRAVEKERLEMFGGGRAAVLDDFRRLTLAGGGRRTVKKSSADKRHRAEMQSLIAAVQDGLPSPIAFNEIIQSTVVTLAAQEALSSGHPVLIPSFPPNTANSG